jgi:hemerythrin
MTNNTPPNINPHAICAALRHARNSLCHRVELAAGAPDREFAEEFPTLVCAIENAFRREQLVMELLGHPALQERIEDDALMLGALHRVLPAIEHGNIALGRQVVTALRDLLDLHRLTADLALALATSTSTCPAYVPAAHESRPDVRSNLQPQHALSD